MRHDESELLQPWLSAFERVYGALARVAPLRAELRPAGAPDDLFVLSVPRVFERPEMLGSSGHFRHMPKMAAHVRSLGFDWDDTGMITTTPTPSTFNELVPRIVGTEAGYRLMLHREDRMTIGVATWLSAYLEGKVPIHVASAAFYKLLVDRSARAAKSLLESLLHDLTVHSLNYHLVPHASIADLTARIRTALPERAASWSKTAALAPVTLSYFFDNDFNRYCYAVWCRTAAPADFARIFTQESNYRQLLSALSIRIRETEAGIGDIPSEDADHMPKLESVTYDIP